MTEQPHDPFGPLAADTVQLHELFKSLVGGGFTEDQAMQIICNMMNTVARAMIEGKREGEL